VIQFEAGVWCHVFTSEIALVLRRASDWAFVEGAIVIVTELCEADDTPTTAITAQLDVDVARVSDHTARLALLGGYLERTLAPAYVIDVTDDRVRVEWAPPN